MRNTGRNFSVGITAFIKHPVKPTKKASVFFVLNVFSAQQGHTQSWRQDNRHQYREGHRRYNGDRELAINRTGRAAKECHGNKYRRQHYRYPHQRAGNLGHGFFGSFFGIEAFFFHQALDVFYHHDGVIHQQADSQHHGKHGQYVDTKTEGIEHSKGTQQHYRYGNGWYQRRTPVLQE